VEHGGILSPRGHRSAQHIRLRPRSPSIITIRARLDCSLPAYQVFEDFLLEERPIKVI